MGIPKPCLHVLISHIFSGYAFVKHYPMCALHIRLSVLSHILILLTISTMPVVHTNRRHMACSMVHVAMVNGYGYDAWPIKCDVCGPCQAV